MPYKDGELKVPTKPGWGVDVDEKVAYLGVSAEERASALTSLEAPDFTLPDLEGRPHSLSEYRGKKVLLVAYASW